MVHASTFLWRSQFTRQDLSLRSICGSLIAGKATGSGPCFGDHVTAKTLARHAHHRRLPHRSKTATAHIVGAKSGLIPQ